LAVGKGSKKSSKGNKTAKKPIKTSGKIKELDRKDSDYLKALIAKELKKDFDKVLKKFQKTKQKAVKSISKNWKSSSKKETFMNIKKIKNWHC